MAFQGNQEIADALEKIQRENDGLLRPVDVVEAARPKSSPLHTWFQWDDSVAAHQYRLIQARQLIVRVLVEHGEDTEVQAFVSLTPDREEPGGGYRSMDDILGNPTWYEQMLSDALDVLQRAKEKYGLLKDLKPVFEEVEKVRAKRTRTKQRA